MPEAPGRGMPRLRQPERHQLGWQVAMIDDLVGRDHPVRAVWAFVEALDLRALHDAVKAREGVTGQAPPAPELMMALWLWATVDGVGSARQLDRLCEQHLAYRWLCGGVSMNYHTLSDFRLAHATVLDRLLAGGVAALVAQGLVALDVLAQDGLRVRAAAGAGSFRRRERLSKLAVAAKGRAERLRTELGAGPADYLVDGGFTKNDDIEWAHASGIKLWCPPAQSKHGSDPYAPRGDDKPGVAEWRRRMASEPGKALYKERSKAECPNAWARRMGLAQLHVRGKQKARAVLLWFALAHNMLRAFALRRAAMAASG